MAAGRQTRTFDDRKCCLGSLTHPNSLHEEFFFYSFYNFVNYAKFIYLFRVQLLKETDKKLYKRKGFKTIAKVFLQSENVCLGHFFFHKLVQFV